MFIFLHAHVFDYQYASCLRFAIVGWYFLHVLIIDLEDVVKKMLAQLTT